MTAFATQTWAPATGRPEQLLILLHGVGASAAGMAPLAQLLQRQFPQALVLAFDGGEAFDGGGGPGARQWFSVQGVTEDNRPARVAAVLPALAEAVRAAQAASGVGPQSTALFGFSQGAILALELAQAHDGLAGRVVAFSGRYARLPDTAPQHTTLHLLHGADDAVMPVALARAAMERLGALHGDATIDIAAGVGHELAPVLVQCALQRLTGHIPHRTWAAAMGAVPGLAERGRGDALDD